MQVCILSMGSDPTDLIMGLAKKKKKEVLSVSMGQGQEVVARRFCDQGVATGCWVLLQNCHLGIKFLIELEQRLAAKDAEVIDSDFRVWITSEPHPSIPIGLLQMSIKITNEAPVGMKAGMKRSYAWITQARGGRSRLRWVGWRRDRRVWRGVPRWTARSVMRSRENITWNKGAGEGGGMGDGGEERGERRGTCRVYGHPARSFIDPTHARA